MCAIGSVVQEETSNFRKGARNTKEELRKGKRGLKKGPGSTVRKMKPLGRTRKMTEIFKG